MSIKKMYVYKNTLHTLFLCTLPLQQGSLLKHYLLLFFYFFSNIKLNSCYNIEIRFSTILEESVPIGINMCVFCQISI